jgi:hypothetical protein
MNELCQSSWTLVCLAGMWGYSIGIYPNNASFLNALGNTIGVGLCTMGLAFLFSVFSFAIKKARIAYAKYASAPETPEATKEKLN